MFFKLFQPGTQLTWLYPPAAAIRVVTVFTATR